ncbi:glycosyltransferase [Ectothiorhodospira sp. BSL-9]|uniref:glycosyltransferase n=1 Tax=Ectothiorhodospira sp. BSL-9 TaxID=1442136 RepID=UPI0007B43B38|nr:glycosyltransferase [Ectothiorhodospira sp. BSL-9]ANB01374.1 glycosyl transferase family 1 [Ectothiorhodospira sp. BSL-9]
MNRLAVFAATSGHSGVDRILGNLLPALAARGVSVDLLRIRQHGPYMEATEGVRIVELPASHVNTALPCLVRYLRQARPDVMLSDKDKVNRVAILAARVAGVPVRHFVRLGTTVSVNLRKRGRLERWLQVQSISRLYRYAEGIIVPSQGVASDLAQWVSEPRKIHVVPSPVVRPDLDSLAEVPIPVLWGVGAINNDIPVIVGVGELSARKDFATLVRAFARVRSKRPCRLVVLGDGREREQLLQLAASLGVADDFRLPGFLENPYPYIKGASLLAHSARWEGMGIVLVEALSLGVPVVSTDCPSGPREVLDGGRLGTLVPVGDDDALANAVEGILEGGHPPSHELRASVAPYRVCESAQCYATVMGFDTPHASIR